MYRDHTIAVIVPAYNEERHVDEVLRTIPDFVDRIYAVDDRSTDETWTIIQEFAAAQDSTADSGVDETPRPQPSVADGGAQVGPDIVPIRHEENQGAGGALRTGYVRAREDEFDIVATMDADGQMDPDQLSTLLDPIVEGVADYTKGNRLARSTDRREMPPFRLVGNWLLTQLTKISSGYWRLQDPQNGYTAISHEALSAVTIEALPDNHEYPNDLLVRLNIARMRVADVAMPAQYDEEESTISYRRFIPTTSITLLKGFLRRIRAQSTGEGRRLAPICYGLGIVSVVMSVIVAILLLGAAVSGRTKVWDVVAVGPSVLVSIAVFLGGMVLDARSNAELGVRWK